MEFSRSKRLRRLPPYLFIEIDQKKKAALQAGADLVDLGVGDPDRPTPAPLLKSLARAVRKPIYHRYPLGQGLPLFRQAAAEWFRKRFGVRMDPFCEICATIGSKEAIGHFPLAFVNSGQAVLCPDPGYPVYQAGAHFAGAEVVSMPLKEQNGFLPDLEAIPKEKLARARLLWLNSPHNPTSAVAPLGYLRHVVEFCRRHDLILAHDMAYSEIYYGDEKPHSALEVKGAKELAIEFHSLSKTFNMTGWRVGFAVGNSALVAGLCAVKANMDSGVVSAIQEMAAVALKAPASLAASIRRVYARRKALMTRALKLAGFEFFPPQAAFYLWVKVPSGKRSAAFCGELLEKAGIVATPGVGFGPSGEGWFRLSLTAPEDRLKLAAKRLAAFSRNR